VYISDNTYAKESVLAMENTLLTALQFRLTTPTSWEFSRRFCRAANADKKTEHLVDVSAWERRSRGEHIGRRQRKKRQPRNARVHRSMADAHPFPLHLPRAHSVSASLSPAQYLLELMLQESSSLSYRPSILAASGLFLSLYTLRLSPWSERLEINTGIRVEELQACVRMMHTVYVKTCQGLNTLKAVHEKYSTDATLKVSAIKPRNM
jgi:hypothetical protein